MSTPASQLLLAGHPVQQTLAQPVQLPQFPAHQLSNLQNLQLLNNHQVLSLQLQRQLQQLTGQGAPGTPPAQSQGAQMPLMQQNMPFPEGLQGLPSSSAAAGPRKSGSESPSSSEESMPLKKRSMSSDGPAKQLQAAVMEDAETDPSNP